jgi:hypothetical protein
MNDEPHVGTIDPHAERNRGDDDVDIFVQERVLMTMPFRVGKPRVIGQRTMSFLAQPCREVVDVAPRQTINNARLTAVPRQHLENLAFQTGARQDAVDEIRSIEGADHLHRIAEAELRHDIPPYARGRRRGEGVHARVRDGLPQGGELPVLRTKVVSPLADAVGFVNRDEADRRRRQTPDRRFAAVAHQSLRREIQQSETTLAQAGPHRGLLIGGHRAVVAGCRHAVGLQRVDLVLHQRNQRRDDEGQPVAHQRRDLKTERLAAAGRQDEQGIAAVDDRVHRFALKWAERGVAPVLLK